MKIVIVEIIKKTNKKKFNNHKWEYGLELDQLFGNLRLLRFQFLQKHQYVFCLWDDNILIVFLAKRIADSQFIRSFHRLVEVASKPTQLLLILLIKICHFIQGLYSFNGTNVIELSDSITYHAAHRLIT